jgi:cobalt-zinc-cadmium efflux system membrane fusion protein
MKLIFLFILSIGLLACGGAGKTDEQKPVNQSDSIITLTEPQLKNAAIVTGKLERRDISTLLRVNGKIDVPPQNMVSVSVPMGGYLRTTHLLPGMHVAKGEVIAEVEDPQYVQLQQDYLTAKAKIGFLEAEYKRQQELNQSRASSDKAFQQAEAEYNAQRVLVSALAQKLAIANIDAKKLSEENITRSINIHSPINGYVSKVNVNIGKYVSPTDVLVELINPNDIHLALKVFEKDLPYLSIGQKVLAFTNNNPEKKYPCEVLLIAKDITAEGNADVHCHFESYDKLLVPGTYMNAEIEVKHQQVLAIPEEALLHFNNRQYVFAQQSANTFALLPVEVTEAVGGWAAVVGGSTLEDKSIVLKGAYALLMAAKNKAGD